MTSILIFLPILAALALLALPSQNRSWPLRIGVAVAGIQMLLLVGVWIAYEPGGGMQFQHKVEWIPSIGIGYRVGLDGLSLPLVAMTVLLFLACFVFELKRQPSRTYVALLLALEGLSIGVFAALDLILFFVFWDLSLVAMYFMIALWGHKNSESAALKFFIYTFLGSLALLLGIIGLYVFSEPRSFDILTLTEQMPMAGQAFAGGLVLLALSIGFAIKTPLFPFHTWLPPAHVEAPAVGSAILAGVMLKMGTYGFVRIAMSILPEQWRAYAMVAVVVGVFSAVYGALVALAQPSFKRLVAYTSINHMGYVLLGLGAVGLLAGTAGEGQVLAMAGAMTQMIAHGLVTGLLFLLTGVLYQRAGTYEFSRFGGLAGVTPLFATATAIAAFASLGLPGLLQFIAEFQIFAGSFAAAPVAVGFALFAVLITSGLLLWTLQRLFLGELKPEWSNMPDLTRQEQWSTLLLLLPIIIFGLFPRWLLDVIEPAARTLVELVAR